MLNIKIVVCDTETGGLTSNCSLLSASFVIVDTTELAIVDELHMNLGPNDGNFTVNPKALAINNIDLTLHDYVSYEGASTQLFNFLDKHFDMKNGEQPYFCAHNTSFDRSFVDEYLIGHRFHWRMIDTQSFVWELYLNNRIAQPYLSYGLSHFGIINEAPHTCEGDALATAEFLINYLKEKQV